MNDEVLVRVEGVSKRYCRRLKRSLWYGVKDVSADLFFRRNEICELRRDEFWAVDDVSFEVKRGECVGLIGRNGAGKTTLLKMLNGLIKPDKGRIEVRGRIGALIALGAGFNPILTGRENVYVNGAVLGLSKREIDTKIDEIIDFAEISDFIDAPVQSYSSGMVVRLGFAVASTMEPDVLLLDEVLAVGDAAFRSKCWQRLGNLMTSTAVILVSHEAYAISRLCDRGILLEKGRLVCDAQADKALSEYAASQDLKDVSSKKIDSFMRVAGSVVRALVSSPQTVVTPGETYGFLLEIYASEDVKIDYALVNICDVGQEIHAQSRIEFADSRIRKGHNRFAVRIGPLFLTQRNFFLFMIAGTNGGKGLLFQSRAELWFQFSGTVSRGSKYCPPGEVIRIEADAAETLAELP